MRVNKLIGTVYVDINNDQVRDLDEKVLANVKLSLYNENQRVFIKSAVTDIDGQFIFDSLKIGEKYYFSFGDSNFRQNRYNDIDLYNGKVNIGRIPFPAVKFFAFQDLNRNQNLDKNEPLLKDILTYTYTEGGNFSFINSTDTLGFYQSNFADNFRFDERNNFWKLNFTQTYKQYYDEIINRNITEVYGGFSSSFKGLVYGYIYNDYDRNNKWGGDDNNKIGSRNPFIEGVIEYGEPNIKLKVWDVSKSMFIDSTITNQWGQFVIPNLKKGKYKLFVLGEHIFTFSGNTKNVDSENQLVLPFDISDESSLSNVFSWGVRKKTVIPISSNEFTLMAKSISYNSILVSWSNNSVNKSDTLELQRSTDNILFKTINKSLQNNGQFSDNNILPNTKYFYRVMIKKDADNINLSDTVSVISGNVLGIEDLENDVFSVFPNPSESLVNIIDANHSIAKIEIYNLYGKNIPVYGFIRDYKIIRINLEQLFPGIYIMDIVNTSGNHVYRKFIKK